MEKVIITYEDKTFVEGIKDQIQQIGGTIEEVIELANIIAAMIPDEKLDIIKQIPGVVFVGEDTPLKEMESDYSWHIDLMKILEFHNTENRGTGIKIAVIDTGIDYNHPALKNNYKGGYNAIKKTNDGMDLGAHGTKVAGVIAADDSQPGMIGVAPDADLYGVCVLSSTHAFSTSQTIQGIAWAIDNNMDIINISLGAAKWTCVYYNSILKKAKEKGIVVVAAAGSDNVSGVKAPAACENSIAVAAIRSNYSATLSNYGKEVDICAPGYYIHTTKNGGGYTHFYGTSAAAPIISGVMALLRKKYPTKSVDELAAVMYSLCKDIGSPGKDVHTGYGVPILSVSPQETTFPINMTSVPSNARITID